MPRTYTWTTAGTCTGDCQQGLGWAGRQKEPGGASRQRILVRPRGQQAASSQAFSLGTLERRPCLIRDLTWVVHKCHVGVCIKHSTFSLSQHRTPQPRDPHSSQHRDCPSTLSTFLVQHLCSEGPAPTRAVTACRPMRETVPGPPEGGMPLKNLLNS